jgi:hypothetical protein
MNASPRASPALCTSKKSCRPCARQPANCLQLLTIPSTTKCKCVGTMPWLATTSPRTNDCASASSHNTRCKWGGQSRKKALQMDSGAAQLNCVWVQRTAGCHNPSIHNWGRSCFHGVHVLVPLHYLRSCRRSLMKRSSCSLRSPCGLLQSVRRSCAFAALSCRAVSLVALPPLLFAAMPGTQCPVGASHSNASAFSGHQRGHACCNVPPFSCLLVMPGCKGSGLAGRCVLKAHVTLLASRPRSQPTCSLALNMHNTCKLICWHYRLF